LRQDEERELRTLPREREEERTWRATKRQSSAGTW